MDEVQSVALDLMRLGWDTTEVHELVHQIISDPDKAEESVRQTAHLNGARWATNIASEEALALLDEELPDSLWELTVVLDFEPLYFFSLLDLEVAGASERCNHAMGRAFIEGALEARAR